MRISSDWMKPEPRAVGRVHGGAGALVDRLQRLRAAARRLRPRARTRPAASTAITPQTAARAARAASCSACARAGCAFALGRSSEESGIGRRIAQPGGSGSGSAARPLPGRSNEYIQAFVRPVQIPAAVPGSLFAAPGVRLGPMAVEERVTFCRICEPLCGMVATVEDGRLTAASSRPRPSLSRGLRLPEGHRDGRRAERPRPRAATRSSASAARASSSASAGRRRWTTSPPG